MCKTTFISLSLAAFALAADITCPIVLDGRVPAGTNVKSFDLPNPIFNNQFVLGAGLNFSDLLSLPPVPVSRFDCPDRVPLEVTINDDSIFNNQTGFRRVGLQFSADSAQDASDNGTKTIHFSVIQDPAKPLNLSHEYLHVWHEAADFSSNQFNFQSGALIGKPADDASFFKVLTRTLDVIYSVPIATDGGWQNFAITMDHDQNTLQVYYSANMDPLVQVTDAVPNDNSGGGQFQMGILKKPTNTEGITDITKNGFQGTGILEGLIYGSLLVEDSANGCISL